ncbi:MAG TPA: transporter associated domain-containing protein [Bacillota bacterium]|nr:transporter associated domain-containing protein [Bacillota bacterium]
MKLLFRRILLVSLLFLSIGGLSVYAYYHSDQDDVSIYVNTRDQSDDYDALFDNSNFKTFTITFEEDVFEEIFGNIQDEFDLTEPSRGSGTGKTDPQTNEVLIPGAERIETVNTLLEIQLVSRFYDTIAGFILEHADDIPAPGYSVEEQGHIFTVHAVSGNRIDTVRIEQRENQE